MAVPKKSTTLSSGFEMPMIGLESSVNAQYPKYKLLFIANISLFSTNSSPPDQALVEDTVKIALRAGYRHIDCAPVYQNEAAVGRGIKASGIPREKIFVNHEPEDVPVALEKTLHDLGTDYIDLCLIHWPSSWEKRIPYTFCPVNEDRSPAKTSVPIASTWAAMENLVGSGKARSIGVSNFYKIPMLEELLSTAKIIPAVNQIQAEPYTPRQELVQWYHSKNIHVTAWGPVKLDREKGINVASDSKLIEIARSINITPTQLALSWAVQRGTSVIPKS